jgi:hypothetical protein
MNVRHPEHTLSDIDITRRKKKENKCKEFILTKKFLYREL